MRGCIVLLWALSALLASKQCHAAPQEPAVAQKPAVEEIGSEDVRNLVYLANDLPVFIRLHVRIEEQGLQAAWNGYQRRLFNRLDKNDDGLLTLAEIDSVPQPNQPSRSRGFFGSLFPVKRVLRPDREPRDGKVTLEEFRAYHSQLGERSFKMMNAAEIDQRQNRRRRRFPVPSEKEQLFDRLDGDDDGKISQKEVADGLVSLHKLDLDDDQTVSRDELTPSINPYLYGVPPTTSVNSKNLILHLPSDVSTTKQRYALLERYDTTVGKETLSTDNRGKDNSFNRFELGLAESVFAEFDSDGDVLIDFDELGELLLDPPADFAVVLRMKTSGNRRQPAVEVVRTSNSGATFTRSVGVPAHGNKHGTKRLSAQVRASADGSVTLFLDGSQFELVVQDGNLYSLTAIYSRQFKAADADNNNYLNGDEAGNQFYFRGTFDEMDADGDGKLFKKEMNAYVELKEADSQSRTELTVTDSGSNLFEIADLNRDRRLSPREMTRLLKKFPTWDADGDGQIARSEISRHFRLTLRFGQPAIPGVPLATPTAIQPLGPVAATKTGPSWFGKMDRNRDGDVSRREFLGSPATFARFDKNGDGLIDAAEAAR